MLCASLGLCIQDFSWTPSFFLVGAILGVDARACRGGTGKGSVLDGKRAKLALEVEKCSGCEGGKGSS